MRTSRWVAVVIAAVASAAPAVAAETTPATASTTSVRAAAAGDPVTAVVASGSRQLLPAERRAVVPDTVHGTCHTGDGTTRLWARISYTVPAGTAATFYSAMTFCWNRSTVTYASTSVSGTVATGAPGVGWSYAGITDNEQFGYRWGGHDSGGFADRRTGHFRYCPVRGTTCTEVYPWIHLYGHYDGSYSLSYSR